MEIGLISVCGGRVNVNGLLPWTAGTKVHVNDTISLDMCPNQQRAKNGLICLLPFWEMIASPRLSHKCSLLLFQQAQPTAAQSVSYRVTYCKSTRVPHIYIYRVEICNIWRSSCHFFLERSLTGGNSYTWSQDELILDTSRCPCLQRESVSHVQTTIVRWWAIMLTGLLTDGIFKMKHFLSTDSSKPCPFSPIQNIDLTFTQFVRTQCLDFTMRWRYPCIVFRSLSSMMTDTNSIKSTLSLGATLHSKTEALSSAHVTKH